MKCRTVLAVITSGALLLQNAAFAQNQNIEASPAAEARPAAKVQLPETQLIPNTGQRISPTAAPDSRFEPLNPGLADAPLYLAGQAVTTVVSPDHNTMLVLTSGYNLWNYPSGANQGDQDNPDSNEYVFVYDISTRVPLKKQVIQVPNTYCGIVFDPSGKTFYVTGGVDDNVHIYDLAASVTSATWSERLGSPVSLGHTAGNGLAVKPAAAGIAITADASALVVANYYNDSITVLRKNNSGVWSKASELDLRPGKINSANAGVPGGEYPFWVVIKGNTTAYISSLREREIDVVTLAATPTLTDRIHVTGQPNKMVLNAAQTRLFVAQDETDSVAVINTANDKIISNINVGAPDGLLPSRLANSTGNNTNSVTLSPDEKMMYVTNANTNNVAVVDLYGRGAYGGVAGLIPTGWYPNSISFSGDGKYMYIVNGKSVTGPNPGNCTGNVPGHPTYAQCQASNQYNLQLIKAGLLTLPVPNQAQLSRLTQQVAKNNGYGNTLSEANQAKLASLRGKIQHVIYIVKENRTYDQILGDLEVGNGDPDLTEFGQTTTPNQHSLARNFVTLDNFFDRSEVSMDGWPWSTGARAPDVVEKQTPVNYAGRGLSYDSEGTNRNINVSLPTLAERQMANPLTPPDPDLLPGTIDTDAPDGPDNEINTGHLWDAALRAGLTVRNYGFFIDLTRYNLPKPYAAYSIPPVEDPYHAGVQVAYATNEALRPNTDPYFRGFDNVFPDFYRYQEWQREFDTNYAGGGLPALSLVRFMHDHTGNFGTAIHGVNTPELQQADNDYAVGLLVQKIAHSIYKENTLIFVIEDDSQDGADHVDSHRSIAFIAGPYVKQKAVVSTAYNTVNMIRTIEGVLGLAPLNLNDGLAAPMLDVFDLSKTDWTYTATPSSLLKNTSLPINYYAALNGLPKPTHDAAYWAMATEGFDFSAEDRFDFAAYNRILWQGLKGNKPYPNEPSGRNLRKNRAKLLARSAKASASQTAK